jgi:hypothetical protein
MRHFFLEFSIDVKPSYMKSSTTIFLLLALLLFACHPDRQLHRLLDNPVKRGKVYHQIFQNQFYTAQLLDSLKNMKKANEPLLYATTSQGNMNVLMGQILHQTEVDSMTCRNLCHRIMENEKTLTIW